MRGAPRKTSAEAVLAAARSLFAAKGVAATSISDLASGTGIAKGTFYRYFESKEALVDALFLPETAELARVMAGDGGKPRIHDIAGRILAFFAAHPLLLSELRTAWRGRSDYRFVAAARALFGPMTRAYFRRDPRHEVGDLDSYSELIVGAALDLCSWPTVEGRIDSDKEAQAMLEDLLKRFFDCEA